MRACVFMCAQHAHAYMFVHFFAHAQQVFQPYAKFWLPVLAQLVLSGEHGGEGLHYFIIDVVVTMLSWSTTAILEVRSIVRDVFVMDATVIVFVCPCSVPAGSAVGQQSSRVLDGTRAP